MRALPTIATKDDVPRAMGIQQTYSSFGNLFAPALAGILVAASGYFWPFVIDAISFFVLATTILLLIVHIALIRLQGVTEFRFEDEPAKGEGELKWLLTPAWYAA